MQYTLSQDIWQTIAEEYDAPLSEDELAAAVRDEYESLTHYYEDTESITRNWVELGCPDYNNDSTAGILTAMIDNIIYTVIGDINA